MTTARTLALIVAAGKGERAGGACPKQFAPLGGRAVVAWSVDALRAHPGVGGIYVVTGADQHDQLAAALDGRTVDGVVTGGADRHASVRAGLEAIAAAGGCDNVLIHDAARPGLPAAVVDRLLAALRDAPGAVPTLACADTLTRRSADARGVGDVVDRSTLLRIQTPQAFHFDAILAAHRAYTGTPATDDAQVLRAHGGQVLAVDGDGRLEKVTMPEDFSRTEAMLGPGRISRTGMGFDVHRLEVGEELWLCGVRVPHDKGLAGHSDADVALHALTDALLGAIAAGDIGAHFPPSDPQWRGAASDKFLAYARDLIVARGGVIDHVDVTIICEAPKIGPHREAMRARIAEILAIDIAAVSVKATTTERLGFTGRGEGIATQAVATVRL